MSGMPTLGTFDWGDLIAVVALLISGTLAVVRILEWRARPNLHVDIDWLAATGEPTRLNVVVSNRGRARGGVRALLLSPSETHDPLTAFSQYSMLGTFPANIEPGELSLFTFQVAPEDPQTFTRNLLTGAFTHLILIDQNDDRKAFRIPEKPPESETRRNQYGRVSKR
jgi:hypothetical protein